ncbi:MAG: glutamine amidotransferase family protein [Eubacteriales bacterium]
MQKEGFDGYRIPSGCAISGIFSKSGQRRSGDEIIKSIALMHERSNGLGGGFAAYGIYPDYRDLYAIHIFYDDQDSRHTCENFLNEHFKLEAAEVIPTAKDTPIKNPPLIWRYFGAPDSGRLDASGLDEKEYVVRCVTRINSQFKGAYVFSSGKNMGCFKAVGYPEDVGQFYRLEDYKAYSWTAHGRYPTNTPGWWGGAHPFSMLDFSVVHNGEISSYDANRRQIEMFGYKCDLLTDTEAITYILDYLVRRQGLSLKEASEVIAAPFWSTIERMPKEDRARLTYLRNTYAGLLINGPFSIILGMSGGIMALNDRLKLRSMVIGEKDDTVYIASEESAIRVISPELDKVWLPSGGEAAIFTLNDDAMKKYGLA